MPLYGMTWQELIGALPPADRAELMALLPGRPENEHEDRQAQDSAS